MKEDQRFQILLTNDDGIQSPGLWAAAAALSRLGYVTVAAPRDQASSTARSYSYDSDGTINPITLTIDGKEWPVYAIGGTPAQTVIHAILEIMPNKPDLVVSGINYGENVGDAITVSGTVGAALEGAGFRIPSLAMSVQLYNDLYFDYSAKVDWTASAHFTWYFAKFILENPLPEDVDLLKVEVPFDATPETPWHITRHAKYRFFRPYVAKQDATWDEGKIKFSMVPPEIDQHVGTDIYNLFYNNAVSVTPISVEMTSRIDLPSFEQQIRNHE